MSSATKPVEQKARELLIERLRAETVIKRGEQVRLIVDGLPSYVTTGDTVQRRNPDGPEAADEIERLQAIIAALNTDGAEQIAENANCSGTDGERIRREAIAGAAEQAIRSKGVG